MPIALPSILRYLGANRVKSADGQLFNGTRHQLVETLNHLFGRLVGKSHGQNPPGIDFDHLDQVSHPLGNDPGFTAAGSGEYQHRTFNSLDGLLLRGIEFCQNVHS